MFFSIQLNNLIEFVQEAGRKILYIYKQDFFEAKRKRDHSPLTQADLDSETYLSENLRKYYPTIPILSEEAPEQQDYALRRNWGLFFLIDPLDGTREFIQRKGEFTINLALIDNGRPILGVIHAPDLGLTYYASKDMGSFKMSNNKVERLPLIRDQKNAIRVTYSRSHGCDQTHDFIQQLKEKNRTEIIELPRGSALKFGLVAEGSADYYPRFSPSMEWDTAAGQIIVNEAGKEMLDWEGRLLKYNKPNLVNPGFIVRGAS